MVRGQIPRGKEVIVESFPVSLDLQFDFFCPGAVLKNA